MRWIAWPGEPLRTRHEPGGGAARAARRAERDQGRAARRAQPARDERRARPPAPSLRRRAAHQEGSGLRADPARRGAARPGRGRLRIARAGLRQPAALRPGPGGPRVHPAVLGLRGGGARRPARPGRQRAGPRGQDHVPPGAWHDRRRAGRAAVHGRRRVHAARHHRRAARRRAVPRPLGVRGGRGPPRRGRGHHARPARRPALGRLPAGLRRPGDPAALDARHRAPRSGLGGRLPAAAGHGGRHPPGRDDPGKARRPPRTRPGQRHPAARLPLRRRPRPGGPVVAPGAHPRRGSPLAARNRGRRRRRARVTVR